MDFHGFFNLYQVLSKLVNIPSDRMSLYFIEEKAIFISKLEINLFTTPLPGKGRAEDINDRI